MPYSLKFVESEGAGCGPGAQTFRIDSGNLPPGLTLAPDGALGGTPSQVGSFQFYVEMREPDDDPGHCAGKRTQKQFTLVVRKAPWITALPARASGSEVGMPLRIRLRARGGSGIFAWEPIAGRLPPGVRLRDDGSITGVPQVAGAFRFVARARDTEARAVGMPFLLDVTPRLVLRAVRLRPAMVARPYRAEIRTTGGLAPKTWKLVRGHLPPGMRFSPRQGSVGGTPIRSGSFRVVLQVRDELEATSTRGYVLVVQDSRRTQGASQ